MKAMILSGVKLSKSQKDPFHPNGEESENSEPISNNAAKFLILLILISSDSSS